MLAPQGSLISFCKKGQKRRSAHTTDYRLNINRVTHTQKSSPNSEKFSLTLLASGHSSNPVINGNRYLY